MALFKQSYVDQLRTGCYLYWQGRRYRVLPSQKPDPLLLHLEELETQEQIEVRVEEILLNQTDEVQIGATLADLQAQIDQVHQNPIVPNWEMLPSHLQQRAERIIAVVETVEGDIAVEKAQAQQEGRSFSRTVALKQACMQLADPIGQTTYYKYRGLYQRYQGDRAALASALRRQSFNQSKFSQAEHHFIDIHILRFYARSKFMRPRPST